MTRTRWIMAAALTVGALVAVPLTTSTEGSGAAFWPPPTRLGARIPPRPTTPPPADQPHTRTPIEHFIVLMQENHTFDNYFGTYPGADGIPPGVCMPVRPQNPDDARCVEPFHLASGTDRLSEASHEGYIAPVDPDHSQSTFQLQYNNGRLDGFVDALNRRNQDGRIAMGYYDGSDLPYYWAVADQYVLFDRFFSSASGGSVLNHFFWIAGSSGGNQDRVTRSGARDLLTIFDRLEQRGISWKFYIQNFDPNLTYRNAHLYPANRASQVTWAPLLALDRFIDDPRLFSHLRDLDEYYVDLQNDTLPAVAYLAPSGNSEHPPGRIQSGQRFVVSLIHALMRSSAWDNSAFLWTYDDWGGWYDHVPPPQVDGFGYGFRVPALLVSAYARRGHVDHTVLDFASILRFIEDNWSLEPLGERDTFAASLDSAFDFAGGVREPRFLSVDRNVQTQTRPVRGLIYATYGGGVAFASVLVLVAGARRRPFHARPGGVASRWRWQRQVVLFTSGTVLGVTVASLSIVFVRAITPSPAQSVPVAQPLELVGRLESAPLAVATADVAAVPTAAPIAVRPAEPVAASVVRAAPPATATARPQPITLLDQGFLGSVPGWPDDQEGTAWFDDDGYHLSAREPSRFVALSAPSVGSLGDVIVRATFRKVAGPPGGGYGVIIRDQTTRVRDGLDQGGHFYVAEVSDRGQVGIWRRDDDHWVDLVPWTDSAAARTSGAANDLEVRASGAHMSLLVNGVRAAEVDNLALTSGSVGAFVGGDFNEVILERFTVTLAKEGG